MPQPHSFTSPRLLVTIPSHFLNLPPPKTLHARVFLNFTASPIQDFLLDSKSFFTSPPKPYMQEYSSTSQPPLSKTSCHDSKSFFKPPPQKNLTCKSMPQLHSFTSPSLLVTIPSHFLNLPPKTLHARVCLNLTASPLQDFLSRFQVIF